MRWTDFFSHLEHDFALDTQSPESSTTNANSADTHLMDVCARAKAAGARVTVGLVTGDVLHISPRAVSTDWFSGLVGGEHGSGIVIPLSAIAWVDANLESFRLGDAPLVTAAFSDVVTDMVRRHAHVTLRTEHVDYAGVIVAVGEGFIDVARQPATQPASMRRFLIPSVVAIIQGSSGWG